MKKLIASVVGVGLLFTTVNASAIQQTICFSKTKNEAKINSKYGRHGRISPVIEKLSICELPSSMTQGSIGDSAVMCGGECKGKTLLQMNKGGWRLIHVIEGLEGGFGMVFEK